MPEGNKSVLTLSNVFSISVSILENGEELIYEYSDGTHGTSKIEYDKEGQPYFKADNIIYYLNEFMRL